MGADWAQFEGLGGGVYCSAGGNVVLSGGCVLEANEGYSSGGGLSIKSARADLNETVGIRGNSALGSADSGSGNGGGIYVTTCYYEGQGVAAWLFEDDGTLFCSSAVVSIESNSATRWGGGLYIGLPDSGGPRADGARVVFDSASVRLNSAGRSITYNGVSLLPAQVATENVVGPLVMSPEIEFNTTTIQGDPAADIGIYQKHSIPFIGTPAYTPGTLAQPSDAQP